MSLFRRRTAPAVPEVTVLSRDGCHLCHDALAIVQEVARERHASVTVIDIDGDPELRRQWSDQVPVVLVDGRQVAVWRVDPERLRAALQGRSAPG